jgi:nucleoside-triphosphatase THEP1
MIYILSGEIRTGKTSALQEWASKRNDVDGLLCPDDADGKRFFLEVKSKTEFPLEVEAKDENDTISVGPFLFSKVSFVRANRFLKTVVHSETRFIILDELGKLELKNTGLHEAAEFLIPNFTNHNEKRLIVVIRDTLLDATVKRYKISNYQLLTKETLNFL